MSSEVVRQRRSVRVILGPPAPSRARFAGADRRRAVVLGSIRSMARGSKMTLRPRIVSFFPLILAFLPLIILAPPSRAGTECRPVRGIGPAIAKFLDEVAVAQAAGRGTLPLRDVLFGVT